MRVLVSVEGVDAEDLAGTVINDDDAGRTWALACDHGRVVGRSRRQRPWVVMQVEIVASPPSDPDNAVGALGRDAAVEPPGRRGCYGPNVLDMRVRVKFGSSELAALLIEIGSRDGDRIRG